MTRIHTTFACIALAAVFAVAGCKTGSQYSRSTGQYIDDKTVSRHVKSELHHDSLTKNAGIKVKTFRGDVHLTGFVDHQIQKDRASEITRDVKGVEWFKNDIVVKNQMPETQPTAQARTSQPQVTESAGAERPAVQSQGTSSGWQRGAGGYRGPVERPVSPDQPKKNY